MTPGQRALLDRCTAVLEADPRIIGAWLMGSLGRGTGDRYSDVDVWAVVEAGDVEPFADGWPGLSERIQPAVLTLRIGRGGSVTISQVGQDFSRLDLTVTSPGAVPDRARDAVSTLFDRGGLEGRLGPPARPHPPAPERVASSAREFLRVLGLLPVVIGRDELVVAASGAGLLRTMLIDLVRDEAALPHPPGALRLREIISPERERMLASLPPLEATRESAIALHLACARQFLPIARRLAAATGATWPSALERAVAGHLRRELGIELET
jgi:hypothetical protein